MSPARWSSDSGTGTLMAMPSAIVDVVSVERNFPSRHDMAIAGAPAALTPTMRVAGECVFIHRPIPATRAPSPNGTSNEQYTM